MVASMADFGYPKIRFGKQPRIAIMGTGSEIVEIGKRPGIDQIRNSNSVMLATFSRRQGAIPTVLPIVRDDLASLKTEFKAAAKKYNVLIVTGGVSVGKYDHTKTALAELGAEIFFDKLRLKPGKPMVFARLGKCLIFGLPGNPVSAAVTFQLFVRTALRLMQGEGNPQMKAGNAVLTRDVRAAKERDTYLPAALGTTDAGVLTAEPLKSQGSSDFIGFSRAEALITLNRGAEISAGEAAPILFL
jgi:molybdopterin molybdotransferase